MTSPILKLSSGKQFPLNRLPTLEQIRQERERRSTEVAKQRALEEARRDADKVRDECKTLIGFMRHAWHVLEPRTEYIYCWHHSAVAEHLEAVSKRQITRLQINQPPATMKSSEVSVFWPAYEWGPLNMPEMRYLTTTYTETYARRDSRAMRDLVMSEWFQTLWPLELTRDSEMDFANRFMGYRKAMPFASLTAGRGNRIIIDDPHSVKTAESDNERAEAVRLFRESATSRLNDPVLDAILVIMHRLHPQDICGEIARLGLPYVKLILPMEYERKIMVTTKWFTDPRKHDGELLCPERVPRNIVEQNKIELGPHAFSTQYQQQALARAGSLFKRSWFINKIVDAVPAEARKHRVRSWDLAGSLPKPGQDPDWTAGVLMSEWEGNYYVEHVERFRDTGYVVRRTIKNTASSDTKQTYIRIPQDPGQAGKEQAASIVSENAGWRIHAEIETGDKVTRAEPYAAQCEVGNVYLLRGDWNEIYLDELCHFPQGKKDQVDASSGAFNFLASKKRPLVVTDDMLVRSRQLSPRTRRLF